MYLGVSLFVRNAIEYDYCVGAAIESVLPVVDQVVVVDCSSDDGTREILIDAYHFNPKVKLITDVKWEVGVKYDRLRIHAEYAKNQLDTDWHFMIQADEVLHENSYDELRRLAQGEKRSYLINRYNLWQDIDKYISFKSPHKPCGDVICRLAPTEYPIIGDAENIQGHNMGKSNINLIHYGFMRDNLVKKCYDMQQWFWGCDASMVDQNIIKHLEAGEELDYSAYGQTNHLLDLPFNHPNVVQSWVSEKRKKR